MTNDVLTLERPVDISDARWAALQTIATLVVSGHTPWCESHTQDDDYSGDPGYCSRTLRAWCAEVVISNGTTDGHTHIALYLNDGVEDDDLTVEHAAAIAGLLEQAADLVKLGNV